MSTYGSGVRDFFVFLLKYLIEQGISVNELVASYVEERNLHAAAQRDLVDSLREHGFDLVQPDIPEGEVKPGADNTTNPVTEKPKQETAAEPQADGDNGPTAADTGTTQPIPIVRESGSPLSANPYPSK